MKTDHICIVGAGPSGLFTAYELIKKGYTKITIVEKTDKIGGYARTIDCDGTKVDTSTLYVMVDYINLVLPPIMKDLQIPQSELVTCPDLTFRNKIFGISLKIGFISFILYVLYSLGIIPKYYTIVDLRKTIFYIYVDDLFGFWEGLSGPVKADQNITIENIFTLTPVYALTYLLLVSYGILPGPILWHWNKGYQYFWDKMKHYLESKGVNIITNFDVKEIRFSDFEYQDVSELIISDGKQKIKTNKVIYSGTISDYVNKITKPIIIDVQFRDTWRYFSNSLVVTCKVTGLDSDRKAYLFDYADKPYRIYWLTNNYENNPSIYQFLVDLSIEDNTESALNEVKKHIKLLGGKVEKIYDTHIWNIPFITDVGNKEGFYERMAESQGPYVYYCGSDMYSGFTVPNVYRGTTALINKYF